MTPDDFRQRGIEDPEMALSAARAADTIRAAKVVVDAMMLSHIGDCSAASVLRVAELISRIHLARLHVKDEA